MKATGWLALVTMTIGAACAGVPIRPVPNPVPTPAAHEVVVPFEAGGNRDVFARVGDVVVVQGRGTVVIMPPGARTVRQVGTGARFTVLAPGIVEITISQGGEQMRIWVRSYLESWQPYVAPFVNGSNPVVYPEVTQVIVVDGGGAVTITPPGVVRQEGTDTRFVVERVGHATITIRRGREQMIVTVESIPGPSRPWGPPLNAGWPAPRLARWR